MRKWTSTAGAIFMAAAAVYTGQALLVKPASAANTAANAKDVAGSTATSGAQQSAGEGYYRNAPTATVSGEAATTTAASPSDTGLSTSGTTTGPSATAADPFSATAGAPTTAPSTQPTATAGTDSGAGEGTSVSSTDVNVNDTGAVEIHVNDANLVEVLRMLSLQSQKNIIASKEVGGKVTANLYGVTVKEALDAILSANGYAYREKGNFIYVYTAKELAEMEKAERKAVTEVFHLHYTPAQNAQVMIKPVLSESAQVAFSTAAASGIDVGSKDAGGNSHASDDCLVITDFPENLDRVRHVLKEVDKRPEQILIEATILSATLNEDNALGVDFTLLGGIKFSDVVGTPAETRVSAPNGGLSNANGGTGVTNYTAASTGFTNNVPTGGLKIGYVQNNIAVFLSALEQVTDTTILANPKVLALNKQRGEVHVGNKDGYKTTTVTENVATESVEFLDTGTRLIFRPFIGDDGYIRMEIHPEDSTGQVNPNGLPSETTTELTSNVMIKDGHTIVIGGLFRESTVSVKSQVPFVGNIPILGNLFKSQRDTTVRQEIIILLTPHIIKDDVTYSKLSEEQIKEAEKLRVGVRRGLMPWGRERLAESDYERALDDLNKAKPDRNAALWHLDSAINLNPTFSEAIDLKQELTGKQVSTADNASIRNFVRKVMMSEHFNPDAPSTQPIDDLMSPATQPVMRRSNASSSAMAAPTTAPSSFAMQSETESEVETQPEQGNGTIGDTDVIPAEMPATATPSTRPAMSVAGCDDCDSTDNVATDSDDKNASHQSDMTAAPTDDLPGADVEDPEPDALTGQHDPNQQ